MTPVDDDADVNLGETAGPDSAVSKLIANFSRASLPADTHSDSHDLEDASVSTMVANTSRTDLPPTTNTDSRDLEDVRVSRMVEDFSRTNLPAITKFSDSQDIEDARVPGSVRGKESVSHVSKHKLDQAEVKYSGMETAILENQLCGCTK